ncbi:MAG: glycosyltransferase [Deltaproteobacteria bacterium]|jgi:spore maturation protein CgeB|nr:glycosyltransferase [Deltaproteobacteria bacterium]
MDLISPQSPTLLKNLDYLSEINHPLAEYLTTYPHLEGLELIRAQDGSPVLVVDGASQDSRLAPQDQAQKLLAQALNSKPELEDFWLFGLGSPITLSLARELLPGLSVYEPDPRIILANFCLFDLIDDLKTQKLKILSPFDKAAGRITPKPIKLITHQPSKRRDLAAWTGLVGLLDQKKLASLRILITPPYFGGSAPMAKSIHRAATALGLHAHLHHWSEKLSQEALNLRVQGQKSSFDLLAASAHELIEAAQEFQPSLIFNLAQAPLEVKGLARLRSEVKGALLAFWFVEDYFRFQYVKEIAPAYDLFFHIQGDLLSSPIRRWGLNNAHYLPAAADHQSPWPPDLSLYSAYKATLSAHGAGYPNRQAILSHLAQNFWPQTGLALSEFKIFGSGYQNSDPALKAHLFENGRRLTTSECSLAYALGQINLNIHSGQGSAFDQASAFVNPRTFELALRSSLQIVDNRLLLPDLFSPDELEIVNDPQEIPSAITKHLAQPELGLRMGQKARQRVLNDHLYTHRLQSILETLNL